MHAMVLVTVAAFRRLPLPLRGGRMIRLVLAVLLLVAGQLLPPVAVEAPAATGAYQAALLASLCGTAETGGAETGCPFCILQGGAPLPQAQSGLLPRYVVVLAVPALSFAPGAIRAPRRLLPQSRAPPAGLS